MNGYSPIRKGLTFAIVFSALAFFFCLFTGDTDYAIVFAVMFLGSLGWLWWEYGQRKPKP